MAEFAIGISFFGIEFKVYVKDLQDLAKALDRLRKRNIGGYYYVKAKHSGRALDVIGWSRDDGANVIQYDFHGGDNQQWMFVQAPDNYYFIFSKHSGKCLDVCGAEYHDGANIFQYSFHGGDNQKWLLRREDDGCVSIIAKHSSKAMDVEGYSQDNFANVHQYTYHGGDNQKWKLESVVRT